MIADYRELGEFVLELLNRKINRVQFSVICFIGFKEPCTIEILPARHDESHHCSLWSVLIMSAYYLSIDKDLSTFPGSRRCQLVDSLSRVLGEIPVKIAIRSKHHRKPDFSPLY